MLTVHCPYNVCDNSDSTLFEFINKSSTVAINDSYRINWGDGTPDFTSTSNWTKISHTYQKGLYNLTYTITTTAGCTTETTYSVFVGANPGIGLINPGNTNICQGESLSFEITGTKNNPESTIYTVNFNDGTPPILYNHNNLPSSITHTFNNSSCGTLSNSGSVNFPNSFSITFTASNQCGVTSSEVVPIYVTEPPQPEFEFSNDRTCINTEVTINDTSPEGTVSTDGSCSNNFVWEITPSTYTLINGNLGNTYDSIDATIWALGSASVDIIFNEVGTYTVKQIAANRCSSDVVIKTKTIEIVDDGPVITSTFTPAICSNNTFEVNPLPSNPNVTYTWSTPIISPTGIINGGSAQNTPQTSIRQTLTNNSNMVGTATYTVTPAEGNCNGQPFTVIVTVSPAPLAEVTKNDVTCFGNNDGSLNIIEINGGNPHIIGDPYNVSWTGPNGFTSTDETILNLEPGIYELTVDDLGGCPYKKSFTINEPQELGLSDSIKKSISCFGADDGSISIIARGGNPGYTYGWTKDGLAFSTNKDISNLQKGIYEVTITDTKNCEYTHSFEIIEPDVLSVSRQVDGNFNCADVNNGALEINVTGGTLIEVSPGKFDYNYFWVGPNGFTSTAKNLSGVPGGEYSITVTDANGCEVKDTFNLVLPLPIVIEVKEETVLDCDNLDVFKRYTAEATGGVLPYTISWSDGNISGDKNEVMSTSQNGLYSVIITDATGCENRFYVNVDVPDFSPADFNVSSEGYRTFGIYSKLDPIQFNNTTEGDFLYLSWDFGDGNFSTEENPVHTYTELGTYIVTLTVTYNETCQETITLILEIEEGYKIMMPTGFTPNSDGLNDYFKPVFKGLKYMHLKIYNTWGGLVYMEKGENIMGWDGRIRGEMAQNGNYYYTLSAQTFFGFTVNRRGPVTLIL